MGLGGRNVVAEEEELLGLLDPDQPGQQPGAAGVGGDAPADEDLDEPRLLGRHHEVAGERQVHAAAGGRAVDPGDDRLLAVEDRRRPAAATRSGSCGQPSPTRVVGAPSGRAARCARPAARSAPVQKAFGPAAVITTARTSRSAEASSSQSAIWSAHGAGHGVAGVGAVQGDPGDAVFDSAGRTSSPVAVRPTVALTWALVGAASVTARLSLSRCLAPGSGSLCQHDQRVGRHAPFGPGQQRVDVQLGHLVGQGPRPGAAPS